ncbi:hypothetical protein FRC08_010938 [Ceratobasidium sp. 394]|nr:hypothetical protein FRC08_010938 [Ceratobasidium sp. 394]
MLTIHRPMVLALIATEAVGVTFIVKALQRMTIMPNPAPEIYRGCRIKLPISEFRVPLISSFIFDTGVFLVCLQKTWVLTKSGFTSPLIVRLMRDGTLYYLAYTATLGWVMLSLGKGIAGHLLLFQSVLYSRMILSLRTFEHEDRSVTTLRTGELGSRTVEHSFIARPRGDSLIELEAAAYFSKSSP